MRISLLFFMLLTSDPILFLVTERKAFQLSVLFNVSILLVCLLICLFICDSCRATCYCPGTLLYTGQIDTQIPIDESDSITLQYKTIYQPRTHPNDDGSREFCDDACMIFKVCASSKI